MTTVSFVLFVVLSLALAILSGKQRSSVMEEVEVPVVPVVEEAIQPEAVEPAIAPLLDEGQPTDEATTDDGDDVPEE